jgi:hypothetical protein
MFANALRIAATVLIVPLVFGCAGWPSAMSPGTASGGSNFQAYPAVQETRQRYARSIADYRVCLTANQTDAKLSADRGQLCGVAGAGAEGIVPWWESKQNKQKSGETAQNHFLKPMLSVSAAKSLPAGNVKKSAWYIMRSYSRMSGCLIKCRAIDTDGRGLERLL